MKRLFGLSVLLLAVGANLLNACGDDPTKISVTSPPNIVVQVDNKAAPVSPSCVLFTPDETGGQLAKHRQIVITNTGAAVGATIDKLCLKLSATKTNSQFKLSVVSGATKDDAFCSQVHKGLPGAMAALEVSKGKLVLDIEYRANESGDKDPFVLTIESNSGNTKGQSETAPADVKKQLHCFNVAKTGVCPLLTPTEYSFTNATAGAPPTACFNLQNCSSTDALTFQGAEFGTNNSQYEIIEQPNANEVIPPKGDELNKDGQKSLKICVRYKPDDTPNNEDVTLSVKTNAPTGPVQVLITAKTQEEAKWNVTCSDPTGKTGFYFTDATKAEVKKCKVCNDGPPPLKLQDVKAEATNANDDVAVAKALKCRVVDGNGAEQNPYAVNASKCADIVCDYTPPGTGKPPSAACHISHSSAGAPSGAMYLPIAVGGCDTPEMQFGPSPESSLFAKPGATAAGTVVIGNQSCAPLQVVNVCIAAANYKGNEPCQNPSKNHVLETAFSPTGLPGFGVLAIGVKFTPDAKATVKGISDLMHVSYCSGTWAGGACNGGQIVTRALNLQGIISLDGAVTPPVSVCAVQGDAKALKVGTPVTIKNSAPDKGSFKDQTFFFRWIVSKRPAGATTWLPEGQQSTDQTDVVKVLPDVPGDYEVLCQVQGIDNADANKNAWSPLVAVPFTVNPK